MITSGRININKETAEIPMRDRDIVSFKLLLAMYFSWKCHGSWELNVLTGGLVFSNEPLHPGIKPRCLCSSVLHMVLWGWQQAEVLHSPFCNKKPLDWQQWWKTHPEEWSVLRGLQTVVAWCENFSCDNAQKLHCTTRANMWKPSAGVLNYTDWKRICFEIGFLIISSQ